MAWRRHKRRWALEEMGRREQSPFCCCWGPIVDRLACPSVDRHPLLGGDCLFAEAQRRHAAPASAGTGGANASGASGIYWQRRQWRAGECPQRASQRTRRHNSLQRRGLCRSSSATCIFWSGTWKSSSHLSPSPKVHRLTEDNERLQQVRARIGDFSHERHLETRRLVVHMSSFAFQTRASRNWHKRDKPRRIKTATPLLRQKSTWRATLASSLRAGSLSSNRYFPTFTFRLKAVEREFTDLKELHEDLLVLLAQKVW